MDAKELGVPWDVLKRLNRETNCITSLYRLSLNGGRPWIHAVKIDLSGPSSRNGPGEWPPNENFFVLWWTFPLAGHFLKSDFERKLAVLETLHEALMWLSSRMNWPSEPLLRARQACLGHNLENRLCWKNGKRWMSPDRKTYAKVCWDFGLERVKVYLIVETKGGTELVRYEIMDLPADEYVLSTSLHKLEWSSCNEIIIRDWPGRITHRIQIGSSFVSNVPDRRGRESE